MRNSTNRSNAHGIGNQTSSGLSTHGLLTPPALMAPLLGLVAPSVAGATDLWKIDFSKRVQVVATVEDGLYRRIVGEPWTVLAMRVRLVEHGECNVAPTVNDTIQVAQLGGEVDGDALQLSGTTPFILHESYRLNLAYFVDGRCWIESDAGLTQLVSRDSLQTLELDGVSRKCGEVPALAELPETAHVVTAQDGRSSGEVVLQLLHGESWHGNERLNLDRVGKVGSVQTLVEAYSASRWLQDRQRERLLKLSTGEDCSVAALIGDLLSQPVWTRLSSAECQKVVRETRLAASQYTGDSSALLHISWNVGQESSSSDVVSLNLVTTPPSPK